MSVVDEIRAAIENLNGIRSECGEVIANDLIPAVFFRTDDDTDEADERFSYGIEVAVEEPEFATSIEVLFRTIDAQLAILQNDLKIHADYQIAGRLAEWIMSVSRAGDLALARAINGTDRTVAL